jgi:hypothetical protein
VSVLSFPTRTFTALIADYRKVAEDAGLAWNQRLSSTGAVVKAERWNLTKIAETPGETIYLSHLGTDRKTLAEINRRRAHLGEHAMEAAALPRGWQALLRALVPASALDVLEGPGLDAFRLIETSRAQGELVSRFKALQTSDSDEAALAFLSESVDQIQLTPYGACTASFVSEPCPKHLTCLSVCSHLIRTSDAKTVANNRKLLARYQALLEQCPPPEAETAAQKIWRDKLETDVERLRRLVATEPGQYVFPGGDDHGSPYAFHPLSLL